MSGTAPNIEFLGSTAFTRLKTLMKTLRDPDKGCPWDREQSFSTIAPYTIEEAYEVADAIERGDMQELKEELGDLMFQVVFYAQMAEEDNIFNLEDVCDTLTQKMVRRHPHVFEQSDGRSAAQQTDSWETIKAKERAQKGISTDETSILSNVPLGLPALTRAEKLQKRAARVGFDWPSLDGVVDKITEEASELAEAQAQMDIDAIEDEMGDLLFAVTNLSRKIGVDPETALRRTNKKFSRRFEYIETQARNQNQKLEDMSLDEMEALWQAAKTGLND